MQKIDEIDQKALTYQMVVSAIREASVHNMVAYKDFQDHLDGFENRRKQNENTHLETKEALKEITEQLRAMQSIVDNELLPAYQKEMDRKRAYAIINEDAGNLGFWGKLILTLGAVVILVIGFFKFYIIKQ